jgi:ferredoxin
MVSTGITTMANQQRRVWIAEGCIHCYWCQNLAPLVFQAGDHSTRIAGAVRVDGLTSDNRQERSALRTDVLSDVDFAFLPFVADGCPVQVIHLDGGWSDLGIADPGLMVTG